MLPPKAELTIAEDASGQRELLSPSTPVIVKLDIRGVIGLEDLTTPVFEALLLDSREGLLGSQRVKGIFLHIDTPGGTVTDSDGIYRALLAYKAKYNVPIYGFIDGLCASGGMYIACACDKIFATSSSIVGSVGVLMGPNFNVADTMERYGVKSMTITEGKDKDMLNPFRPWVPGEDVSVRNCIRFSYEQFVHIVTTARPMLDKQKLVDEYGAQIYPAPQSAVLGYIDQGESSYVEALKDLVVQAGIGEEEPYQVICLKAPHNFFEQLIKGKGTLLEGKMIHRVEMGPISEKLKGKLLYLYPLSL